MSKTKWVSLINKAIMFYDDYSKCSCCEIEKTEVVLCIKCYKDILIAAKAEAKVEIIQTLKNIHEKVLNNWDGELFDETYKEFYYEIKNKFLEDV